MSKQFDLRHSNVKSQNDTNVERQTVLTFECRTSHCFDFRHSNVESQNDTNVERQTVLMFDIQMSNFKLF